MLISISELTVTYGAREVLHNLSFTLDSGQRAGLVGANGAGKSTLLKTIVGEVQPDAGRINILPGVEIAYLPQAVADYTAETIDDLIYQAQGDLRRIEQRLRELEQQMTDPTADKDILFSQYDQLTEQFERRGGYELDYRADIVLGGLGLRHIQRSRRVATLSGGEKSRLGLATVLLKSPDLLLLDEPTNHLDFAALEWLEGYLAAYRGGILVASHDREFLNRIANIVFELDEHKHELKQYRGNYDDYAAAKEIERRNWLEDYLNQQEELKELRHTLRTSARSVAYGRMRDGGKAAFDFKAGRIDIAISRNVRAIEERLARIEANPIPKPPEALRINPDFDPHALDGKTPLAATTVTKSFGPRRVLDAVSFDVRPHARILIVGPNGAGKSTLLRILSGLIAADSGSVRVGPTVKLGYLDQEQESLDPRQPVFAAWRGDRVGFREDLEADFFHYGLFTYDEADKLVGELSVGQKRKLQIAKLIAERANLLLLDEPTNHVSFDVLEEFEKALLDFPGPIIAVSHDRRFIQRFGAEVWELRDGQLIQQPAAEASYLAIADDVESPTDS